MFASIYGKNECAHMDACVCMRVCVCVCVCAAHRYLYFVVFT